MSGPRIGSLFSGYGGLDMGVMAALGGSVAWHVEFDKAPSKILAHHWPDVPNYGDVTTVDWSAVEPVDIVTGGSPCQDLSHAGKRAGMTEGTRSNLWVAMREAIAQLQPSLVIWENVRGAYSAPADSEVEPCSGCVGNGTGPYLRALGRVLGDLADLGYNTRWHGIRAADVGAPHGRFRIFALASNSTDFGHEWAGEAWYWRPRFANGDSEPVALLGTPRASEWKGTCPLGSKSHQHRLDRDYLDAQAVQLAANPAGGWGVYAGAIERWKIHRFQLPPDPTDLNAKGNPQLSPAFVEWMMGLPAGHVTGVPGLTRNDMLKALGNGVVPQQAAAAIGVILSEAFA